MQVTDLLLALGEDIDGTRQWLTELRTEVAAAEQKLTALQAERCAVENAASRHDPAAAPPVPVADPEWLSLTRVDAIERSLREHGPMHLSEIADLLAQRGRPRDDLAAVSASLSNLKATRQSVVILGQGRWGYAGDPAVA